MDPLLCDIARFLNENKETVKLRKKQISFFDTYDLDSKCSVSGILSIPMDHWGEHIPEHILEILSQAIKGNLLEEDIEPVGVSYTEPMNQQPPSSTPSITIEEVAVSSSSKGQDNNFQTKLIPFDELQLTVESLLSSTQQRNIRNIPRQGIVVCASLIDKITNLAGIVRTCEIFALEELIISDLKVLQSEDFQSMSVASSNWLPIREIFIPSTTSAVMNTSTMKLLSQQLGSREVYSELISYLREMKRSGYQIVGVEQTGGSVSLESAVIHSQCVIVLGREKEGIPVELLNEMDLCVEIPQYGVTRSLNVHVSASLVIWEITKRNIESGRI
jgi:tRNA guanosine-2'-O-methyltransferase